MEYVIIRTGGKQYKASVGDTLEIDKLSLGDKKNFTFDEVLLSVDGENVSIGNPIIAGVRVNATLVEQKKGDKIRVSKFKAKSRYRKVIGFRPQISVVKIDKIETGSKKTEEKVVKPSKTAPKTEK